MASIDPSAAADGRSGLTWRKALYTLYRCFPGDLRRWALAHATTLVAPRPDPLPASPTSGLVIVGEFSHANGIGQGARLMSAVAKRMGLRVWEIDVSRVVPGGDERAPAPRVDLREIPPGAPLVVHVNPPVLAWTLLHLPRRLLRGRRVIGYWAWELSRVAANWKLGFQFVHEVWAPSRFTAAAIAEEFHGPVHSVPHPVAELPPVPAPMDRSAFGLPHDAVVVLTSFNLASSLARKNPEAAVAAFRAAFGDRPDRLLLLKVANHHRFPADFAALRELVSGLANVRLETRILPRSENDALTAACDIVLSLHRSEGFGLVPAEAMLLGLPVVATNWSATAEFLTPSCGIPVPFALVPARDPRGVYEVPDAVWAEPDIGAAAEALRALAADSELRRALGAAARSAARVRLGAGPLAAAVTQLGLEPRPAHDLTCGAHKSLATAATEFEGEQPYG